MAIRDLMSAPLTRVGSAEAAVPRGQERSFEALYDAHFDFAWRTLRRLGVHVSVLDDAAQDTFVVLHRRLSELRPDASPRAFVFAIAQRVAHDYRRSARRKPTSSLEAEIVSREASPFEDTAKAQASRLVQRFLGELDEDKRAVFMLADLEEMSAPEISEALAVNLNTVYSRLRAARQRLVEFLEKEGAHRG
ncbi:MAG: RNA polymerase sigma factor [Myxococcales bacterium]